MKRATKPLPLSSMSRSSDYVTFPVPPSHLPPNDAFIAIIPHARPSGADSRSGDDVLRLFAEGKIRGTVHTCVGQEFSALAFAGQLDAGDSVFSNHRGHGHLLAFTDDVEDLIAELLARRTDVCAGSH